MHHYLKRQVICTEGKIILGICKVGPRVFQGDSISVGLAGLVHMLHVAASTPYELEATVLIDAQKANAARTS